MAKKGRKKPVVKAFMTADLVFRQASGKWCIIGVFDAINCRKFPARHQSLGLWMRLADLKGTYRLRVEYQDSLGRQLGVLPEMEITVSDPLEEPEIGIQTSGLILPEPGTYFLKPFFNDVPAETDIRIRAVEVIDG